VLLFLTVAVVNAVRGSWVDLLEAN